jgi:hypothetical protein
MRATWYSKNGEARDVLVVGELPTPTPAPGEVRVKLATSGVNPSDVKSRSGRPLGGERIVPHSDGAGIQLRLRVLLRTHHFESNEAFTAFDPGVVSRRDGVGVARDKGLLVTIFHAHGNAP